MKRVLGVVLIIVVILLLGGVISVIYLARRPLGPAIAITTKLPTSTSTVVAQVLDPPTIKTSLPTITQAAVQSMSTCGNKGVMRLVVIGRASPMDINMLGADAVRLVIINFDKPSAGVLALPAELWVDSPVLADQGIDQTQLNLVYQQVWDTAHGNPDAVRTQKATQALAQTIYDNFGFVADHYVTVEDQAFIEFINALGGIDITLAQEVDGTAEGYGIYPAGLDHLDGLRTLNFTRLIHPSGQAAPDWWGSLARQNLILHGMLNAALDPQNLANLTEITRALRKAVTTDLSVNQALDLACMLQKVGANADLETIGPPPYLVTIDAEGRMIPDVERIKTLLAQMEGGG